MIRIEITTVVEIPVPRQASLTPQARLTLIRKELDDVERDPIAYQRSHPGSSSITGRMVEGPIASTSETRSVDHRPDPLSHPPVPMLEPRIFPGL